MKKWIGGNQKERKMVSFREAIFALGERKPMDLVRTEPGARLVEQTLEQIRYGISP